MEGSHRSSLQLTQCGPRGRARARTYPKVYLSLGPHLVITVATSPASRAVQSNTM